MKLSKVKERACRNAKGKTFKGYRIANIEVREDGDIWFCNLEYDGLHIISTWGSMTKEERKFMAE